MKRSLLYTAIILLIFTSICYAGKTVKNSQKEYAPCEWKVLDSHFHEDKQDITWISKFMHKDSSPSSPEFLVTLSYNSALKGPSSDFEHAEKLAEYDFLLQRKKIQIIIFKQVIPSVEAIAFPPTCILYAFILQTEKQFKIKRG